MVTRRVSQFNLDGFRTTEAVPEETTSVEYTAMMRMDKLMVAAGAVKGEMVPDSSRHKHSTLIVVA